MDCVHIETIQTINGDFHIYEIGESVFWSVRYGFETKTFTFHFLASAREYIRDTEIISDWEDLFQKYVDSNKAVH